MGVAIRRLRREAGLSQEDFAERCGLHRTYIGAIERGEKVISIAVAEKVARALGLSLPDFFREVERAGELEPWPEEGEEAPQLLAAA